MKQTPSKPAHRARKRFGQNFLNDTYVIKRIIAAVHPLPEDNLVEIGPGKGALTGELLQKLDSLNVIELDRDLVPILQQRFSSEADSKLAIHQADALKFDFRQLASDDRPLRVVGNLPYNISTPLLFHLLTYHQLIKDMHFMLQLEVVKRLAAQPGSKTYGRLSVMTQYYCRIDNLFEVPPSAFSPAPKVTSAIVRLQPQKPELPAECLDTLDSLLKNTFGQRRKTLRNTLKNMLDSDIFEQLTEQLELLKAQDKLDFDLTQRPEQLCVNSFVALSNIIHHLIAKSSR